MKLVYKIRTSLIILSEMYFHHVLELKFFIVQLICTIFFFSYDKCNNILIIYLRSK